MSRRRPEVITAVLPVAYGATRDALLALFHRHAPRVWLGLGVAVTRSRLEIEALAINIEHGVLEDNAGERPVDRPIVPGAPLALRSGLDVQALAARLGERGWPIGVSFHAGTFLCNQALYLGCYASKTAGVPGLAGFVHVPPLERVPLDVAAAAVLEILASLE